MEKDNIIEDPENDERAVDLVQWQNIQANYSAMMYILTEQQALIGTLLNTLLANGAISELQLTKITGIYANPEVLNPVYNELYKRFASYFMRVRHVLDHPDESQPQTPFPKGKDDGDNDDGGTNDGGGPDPTEDPNPG